MHFSVEVLWGHSFLRYSKPKSTYQSKVLSCRFRKNALLKGGVPGGTKKQFFLNRMIPSYAIQSKIGIFNDMNLIYLCMKFQTGSPKDGLDIEVNVWNTLFLHPLINIKGMHVYGCKHIKKIFQNYKKSIKCKLMYLVFHNLLKYVIKTFVKFILNRTTRKPRWRTSFKWYFIACWFFQQKCIF